MSPTPDELSKMTLADKLQIVNNLYVTYPRFQEILSAMEYCHQFSSGKDEPECMFLGSIPISKTWLELFIAWVMGTMGCGTYLHK